VAKARFLLLSLAFAAMSTPLTGSDSHDVLRVYNWPEYIGADTLARFEAETGIRVIYETFDSNETLERSVTVGSTFYDVVVPSSPFFNRQVRAGVYRPLDPALVPNLRGLDPGLAVAAGIAGNQHGAIYLWGTSGIGYNVDMIVERLGPEAPVTSWALVFDPANAERLADCGINLLDSGYEVVPMVLAYLGLPTDSTEPEHLAAAEAALAAIRPYVRSFDSEDYIDALAAGELCVSVAWSGDALMARARAPEDIRISYAIPEEGTAVFFDVLAIPVEAPNPRGAHAFIDFLLRPDVIAEITNTVYFPNAVPASLPLVTAFLRDDPAIYPDAAVRARLFPPPVHEVRGARGLNGLWSRIRGD
jgi:putrescine transport system substrate-binding protein